MLLNIGAAVRSSLSRWSGYEHFDTAMTLCPRTHVFVAGGAVRDVLRGKQGEPKDFDFFVGGDSVKEFVAALASQGSVVAGPFGSPRWLPPGAPNYADVIPIATFNNGLWPCRDMKDALNQFDFTANAIAVDLRSGAILNPQNGISDALANIMRAVRFDYPGEPITPGNPLSRLGVLWIRIIHYSGALGLAIEPVTKEWLRRHRRLRQEVDAFAETFFAPDLSAAETL